MSDNTEGLPERAGKAERQASQEDLARAERALLAAREAEGKVGGRPGRESGGTWSSER